MNLFNNEPLVLSTDQSNIEFALDANRIDLKDKLFMLLINKEDIVDAKQLNNYKDVAALLCQPYVDAIDLLATEYLPSGVLPYMLENKEGTILTNLEYMMLHLHILMDRMDNTVKMSIQLNATHDEFVVYLCLNNKRADKVIVASMAPVLSRVYNFTTNLPLMSEKGDMWFDYIVRNRDLDEYLMELGADVAINISPRGDYRG